MKRVFCCLLFALLLPLAAAAEGLRTVRPAVLYDGPATTARPKAILSGGYPLRQISKIAGWRKVSTYSGDNGFVQEQDLGAGRRAVVVAEQAVVYSEASDKSPPVFLAWRGVVLTVLGRKGRWVQVAHPDGETGYVAAAEVWNNS